MAAYSAHQVAVSTLPGWTTFFAKETEPDLDFEEDLDDFEDSPSPGYTSKSPRKKPGKGPILLVLVVLVAGAGGYYAMDPDGVMELIRPLMGESPPPPAVVQPPPKPAAKVPAALSPAPTTPAPVTAPPLVTAAIPSPQFSEGQQVSVILDPAAPGGSLSLSADPAQSRPGPNVQPGATLTVLDGDLQNNSWVYSVRTQDGAVGWIAEKRLVAKP